MIIYLHIYVYTCSIVCNACTRKTTNRKNRKSMQFKNEEDIDYQDAKIAPSYEYADLSRSHGKLLHIRSKSHTSTYIGCNLCTIKIEIHVQQGLAYFFNFIFSIRQGRVRKRRVQSDSLTKNCKETQCRNKLFNGIYVYKRQESLRQKLCF